MKDGGDDDGGMLGWWVCFRGGSFGPDLRVFCVFTERRLCRDQLRMDQAVRFSIRGVRLVLVAFDFAAFVIA